MITETIKIEIPTDLVVGNSQEINYDLLKGKTLIGLSGFARSGKDSIAKILTKRLGFKRVSFADTLKRDLNEYFKVEVFEDLQNNNININFDLIDFLNPPTIEIKEILRPYMIWFGEEMKKINGIHHWTNRAFSSLTKEDQKIVITDVRRINELELFRNSKEYQKRRNQNRANLGITVDAIFDINSDYNSLLFYVNQLHVKDDDNLTVETILQAMTEWIFEDTIYVDSRIQDINNYRERHLMLKINELVLKYPEYFI